METLRMFKKLLSSFKIKKPTRQHDAGIEVLKKFNIYDEYKNKSIDEILKKMCKNLDITYLNNSDNSYRIFHGMLHHLKDNGRDYDKENFTILFDYLIAVEIFREEFIVSLINSNAIAGKNQIFRYYRFLEEKDVSDSFREHLLHEEDANMLFYRIDTEKYLQSEFIERLISCKKPISYCWEMGFSF